MRRPQNGDGLRREKSQNLKRGRKRISRGVSLCRKKKYEGGKRCNASSPRGSGGETTLRSRGKDTDLSTCAPDRAEPFKKGRGGKRGQKNYQKEGRFPRTYLFGQKVHRDGRGTKGAGKGLGKVALGPSTHGKTFIGGPRD